MTGTTIRVKSLDNVVVEEIKRFRIKIGLFTGPEYEEISDITLVDQKVVYRAKTKDGKYVVNFDGDEGPKYREVWGLTNIGDKYAYAAENEDREWFVVVNDQEGPKYLWVTKPISIGNKPAYAAQNEDGKYLVNFDGKEIFDKSLLELKGEFEGK